MPNLAVKPSAAIVELHWRSPLRGDDHYVRQILGRLDTDPAAVSGTFGPGQFSAERLARAIRATAEPFRRARSAQSARPGAGR